MLTTRILFFLSTIFLLVNCGASDSCDGIGPTEPGLYSVNNYSLYPVIFTEDLTEGIASHKSNININEGENENVSWENFGIEISADTEEVYSKTSFKVNFSLFQLAHSCSSAINDIATQNISNLSIQSDNAFLENSAPGDQLKEFFEVVNFNAYLTPIAEHTLDEYSVSQFPAPINLQLHLLRKPENSRQNFTVELTLDDGSIFMMETGDIFFSE